MPGRESQLLPAVHSQVLGLPRWSAIVAFLTLSCNGERVSSVIYDAPDAKIAAEGGVATVASNEVCAMRDGWSPLEPRYCTIPPEDVGASSEPYSVYGRVVALEPGRLGEPCRYLADVSVCLHMSRTECVTSGEDGTFVLGGLPQDREGNRVEIQFDGGEMYQPFVRHMVVGSPVFMPGVLMWTREMWNRTRACAGAAQDPDRGEAWLSVFFPSSSGAGVRLNLSPESGIGPHYMVGTADPARRLAFDPDLDSIQAGGSGALWFDVEPGEYALRYTAADGFDLTDWCLLGWRAETDGSQVVRIRKGEVAHVHAFCSTLHQ